MKSLFNLFVGSSFLLINLVWAGNDHDNGGGLICVNDNCKSLADSGLGLSSEFPDFWLPTNEALSEVNSAIDDFPLSYASRSKVKQKVLGKLTHFKAVEVIDQAKLDAVKQYYIDTIKKTSPHFDLTNFKIFALSSDETAKEQNTYLLPDFFNLTAENQAKILIHEGFYRGRPTSDLRHVLQLETALSAERTKTNMISAQIAAYNLGLLSKAEIFGHLVLTTYSSEDYSLSRGYWFSEFSVKNGELVIDIENVQREAKEDNRTAAMMLNLGQPIKMSVRKSSEPQYTHHEFRIDINGDPVIAEGELEYRFAEPEKLNLLLPK